RTGPAKIEAVFLPFGAGPPGVSAGPPDAAPRQERRRAPISDWRHELTIVSMVQRPTATYEINPRPSENTPQPPKAASYVTNGTAGAGLWKSATIPETALSNGVGNLMPVCSALTGTVSQTI